MKEQLKREVNKTYLILSSEGTSYEETFEIEMIVKNVPETILPLHVLRMDGEMQLYYDISSKQTLQACAERVKLSSDTIRRLFIAIEELIKEVKDYLLDMENVLLDLEHIYTKEGKFYFCYCPWKKQDILIAFRSMLEELLGNLDYHDTEGVELSYHLYQSACKGNFHISKILEEHKKEEEKVTQVEEVYEPYLQEEETVFNVLEEEEHGKNKEKKPGFLRRMIKFFLKKEEPVCTQKEYEFPHEEMYQEFFAEQNSIVRYTEVLTPADANTVLLQNMPRGHWKLRPLVPGYEEFDIEGDSFLVGKKRDSVDGFIGRDTISRIHSRLSIRQERLFISDANSTNGTFVNGVAIEPGKEAEIFQGDRILFADVGYECYNSL